MWNEEDIRMLYRIARIDWEKQTEEARQKYDEARRELRELDLKISAYRNKLEQGIDPDTPEWAAVYKKLRELEQKREEYIKPYGNSFRYGPRMYKPWSEYRAANSRSASGSYPTEAARYFREWLDDNSYFE